MKLKEFLKPDWRKILLTILLMIVPTIFIKASTTVLHSCPVGVDCPPLFIQELFLQEIIITVIGTYLFSCLIVWIYNKMKKKR
jgi:hypothetical protein